MEEVDRFYLAAVNGYSELRKAGGEGIAVYVSPAYHDRIAPHLAKHPAAGFISPEAGRTIPDKIAGLHIHIDEALAEDFVVRAAVHREGGA